MRAILIGPSLFIFIVNTVIKSVENINAVITGRRSNMILEGPVAVYDRVSINNFVITKDTEIDYPEKIPVVWNYEFDGPESVLGYAEISKVENGLWATVHVSNELLKCVMHDRGKIYCGGYYLCHKSHTLSDKVRCVDKANLMALGVYETGDEWLYLKVK